MKSIKLYFLISILLLFFTHLNAQVNNIIRVNGIPKNTSNKKLIITRYYADNFEVINSKNIGEDTSITIEIPSNYPTGLFQIYIEDKTDKVNNQAEFIFNNKELIQLDANYYELKNGSIGIRNSKENEAYYALLKVKEEYEPILNDLYEQRNKIAIIDSNYKKKCTKIELEAEKVQLYFDNQLTQVTLKYPETYTAKYLIPITLIPVRSVKDEWADNYDSYISFLAKYYFHHCDFNNENYLYHYAFHDKIYTYLNLYTEKSNKGTIDGIDQIMKNEKSNEHINNFIYNTLLKTFIKMNSESLTKYLVDNYNKNCSLNLSFEDLKKLNTITSLSIGNVTPEISLQDTKGNFQSLRAYAQKNKYTVVYFWISWCATCQVETPQLIELYKKFSPKGLGVYAVSLDEKKEDWVAAIEKYKCSWMNVSELTSISKSQYLPVFNVSHTPSIFILNNKGEIIQKGIYKEKLNEYIESLFP